MELKPSLSQRQQLTLSPRLYQSLKILRLGTTELGELIQQQLDENPTLELPEATDLEPEAGHELWEQYEQAHRDDSAPARHPAAVNPTDLTASPVTLSDHLILQLDLEELDEDRHRLGLAIIYSLDADGYLRDPVEIIARSAGSTPDAARAVLEVIQRFDPAGIAARSLEECLALQLEQIGAGRVARQIASGHLPQVARGAFAEIARSLKVPEARVRRAVALIRSLNPAPGAMFDSSPPAAAIVPDVYAEIRDGRVRVLANRDTLPPLRISKIYQQMAGAGQGADPETAAYVKEKLQEASRLIRDIEQRRVTVTKVARAVAEAQPDFFTRGPRYLRPLTLDDIASRMGVHPSTISRAILGKYMSTPYGIFEFRYFFAAGYARDSGGELAATAVKKRMAELIAGEDPRRPLSDQKLADLLGREQIKISRRTVAKYREESGLPPSWQRKQEAAG